MTLLNPIQTSFQSGQLSPSYIGRRDSPKYYSGVKTVKNMVITPSGSATRRPPFRFIKYESPGSSVPYLFSFQSAPDKSYLLFVRASISSVSFTIFRRSNGITSQVHSFSSGISNLFDSWHRVSFSQSRDVMYFAFNPAVGSGTKVKKLTRLGDTNWTFEDVDFIDGPFDDINLNPQLKMDASGQSGTITITAKNKATSVNVNYFDATDVGRLIRIRHNVDPDGVSAEWWGCALITSLAGTAPYHTVNAEVQTFGNVANPNETTFGAPSGSNDPAGTKNWRLGAFSDVDGYPSKVAFHQNRLFLGKENRISGSMGNNFERHSPTIPDNQNNHIQTPDSAIDLKMLDLRAAEINWFSSDQVLHIGTNDGRYILQSPDNTLQPANLALVKQSNVGTSNVQPIMIDDTIYCRFDNEALLKTDYNFRRDRYEDRNLNLDSDTILKEKVLRLAKSSYPFNIVWCLLGDGTLAAMTYDAQQEVIAWHTHSIKDFHITDMVSLKAEEEKEVLYCLVVNQLEVGAPRGYSLVELDLTKWDYLKTDTAITDPLLDIYSEYTDVSSFADLDHLEGHIPIAIKDGINYLQTTPVDASGNFTLSESISGTFEIGLPIEIELETFPLDIPSQNTTVTGKMKGIKDLQCQLLNTLSLQAQLSTSKFPNPFKFRKSSDSVSSVPPLFTGHKQVEVSNISTESMSIKFTQPEQAPCTILALSYEVNIER